MAQNHGSRECCLASYPDGLCSLLCIPREGNSIREKLQLQSFGVQPSPTDHDHALHFGTETKITKEKKLDRAKFFVS